MANIVEFVYKISDQITKPLQTIARNTQALEGQARNTQSVFSSFGSTLMKFAGAYIGITQAITQTKAFLNLGIEIEQTRAKFETLTGSLEAGNGLIAKLSELSKKSPFSASDFTKQAETLLAFGIETNKVTEYLSMLGDVAMGDKNKLSGLTLAFAQMASTGKLTGQDLLQMINQGFNPLNEISKKTGKSIAVLKDEMAKGKISTQMVIDAFISATSEGGKFYGMSEKIAQTVGGKINSAFGILRDKLMEMAERLSPFLNRVADAFMDFANNFEKFVSVAWTALLPVRAFANGLFTIIKYLAENKKALASVIAVFLTYRLALWNATLALKGWTIASMLQYKWLLLVEKAQKLLNVTILKNPVMALLTAVSLVVGALVMMRKRTQEASDTMLRLNRTAAGYAADEKARLDLLFDRLKQTNPKSKERNDLVKQLNEMYPELVKNMNLEKASLQELEIAYNSIIDVIDRKARKTAYEEEIVALYKRKRELEKLQENPLENRTRFEKATDWINDAFYGQIPLLKDYIKGRQIKRESKDLSYDIFDTNSEIEKIKNELQALEKATFSSGAGTGKLLATSGSNTDVSGLTQSGARPTNINVSFRNLIEYLNMYPQTLPEGVGQMEGELIEGLLRVVNSANKMAER
jgi:tape measure domain-containing protein